MRRTTFTSAATVVALAATTVVPTGNAAEIAPHHLGDDGQLVCAVKLTGKEDKEIQRFTRDASTALSSALIAVIEEQYSDVPEKGKRLLSDARVRQVVEHVLRGEAPASIDVVHLKSALTLNGYSAFNPAGRAVMMLYLGALVLRDEPARLPQHVLWGGAPGVIYAGDDDAGSDDVVNNLLNWAFSAVPYQGEDLDNLRTSLTASAELGQIDAEASQYNAVIADARHACNAQETVRIEFPGSPRFNKPTPTTPVQTTKAQTATVTSVASSATTTRAETPKSPATVVPVHDTNDNHCGRLAVASAGNYYRRGDDHRHRSIDDLRHSDGNRDSHRDGDGNGNSHRDHDGHGNCRVYRCKHHSGTCPDHRDHAGNHESNHRDDDAGSNRYADGHADNDGDRRNSGPNNTGRSAGRLERGRQGGRHRLRRAGCPRADRCSGAGVRPRHRGQGNVLNRQRSPTPGRFPSRLGVRRPRRIGVRKRARRQP